MAKQYPSKVTPRLRFPEFRRAEGWKLGQLGSSGRFIRGLTYAASDVQSHGLLVLRSTNIQGGALVLDKDLVFVGKDCSTDQMLQPNDIAICMSNGSKALVGKSAEFEGGYFGNLTVGAFCSIFRPSLSFAKLAFKTERYADFVALAIGGGNINNLKNSDLESFEFAIPESLIEQQKIADCLTSLDEVIAAQGRKVEALKAHKRGLMQQLFPRKGETRPRLRFPEFRNAPEWEERKLGEFITERSARASADIPLYSLTIEAGVTPKTERYERSFLVSDEADAYKVVQPEDFAFNPMNLRFGAIGRHSGSQRVALSKYYNIFCCDESVDSRFCDIYFRSDIMVALYDRIATGSLIEKRRVHFDRFLKLDIAFPSRPEQQRIADCLSSIDAQITAESNQLATLKTHKRGLMQQLFPVSDLASA